MKRTRLLVADDHVMFAQGLQSLLSEEFELLGTARNGEELVEATMRRSSPRPFVVAPRDTF